MDIDEDPELALDIPVRSVRRLQELLAKYCELHIQLKPIYDEFQCPICMNTIEEYHATPCGHAFCKECILECLNRKKSCPCCNASVTVAQLSKSGHVDRVIAIVMEEKNKASKTYFEKLINQDVGGNDKPKNPGGGGAANGDAALSPIEQVFHKHMRKSLLAYEDYFQKLQLKHNKGIDDVKAEYTTKMVHAKNDKKGDAVVTALKNECDAKIREMRDVFNRTEEMLVASYEMFLKDLVVSPAFLPVQVTITIASKEGIRIPYVLKTTDSAKDVKEQIKLHFEKLNDPIKEFVKDNIILLKRPHGAPVIEKEKEKSKEKEKKHKKDKAKYECMAEIEILDEDVPILQYKPEPGTSLILQGILRCKSSEPKKCFKDLFEPNKETLMDYYTCKDCKSNWICKSCADTCHKNHTVVEYIKNHKPSWACCYCVKTPCCQLFKKK